MPWIESHQTIERHYKTLDLMNEMGWELNATIGILHRFWWWCVDYTEDGDLRKHNPSRLGAAVGLFGSESNKFVNAMTKAGWIDSKPYPHIHDWWDYIGRFLQVKYKNSPEKWKKIRELYKNVGFKEDPKGGSKGECKNHIPNQPNQPSCSDSKKLSELLAFLILQNSPSYRYLKNDKYDKTIASWAKDIEKMILLDERPIKEIERIIRWCQADSFWSTNILSGNTLRKQYDQLVLKAKDGVTPNEDWRDG